MRNSALVPKDSTDLIGQITPTPFYSPGRPRGFPPCKNPYFQDTICGGGEYVGGASGLNVFCLGKVVPARSNGAVMRI